MSEQEEVAAETTQRQDSLAAQISTVIGLATAAGCYDAADWIREVFWANLDARVRIEHKRLVGPAQRPERDRYKAALEEIAGMDFRGNRSTEMTIAWRALHPGEGSS